MSDNNSGRALLAVFDICVTLFIIGGIIGSVWLYSGQPFPGSPPLVVIETGSMMHEKEPFGRIGYIDPGDIVIAKAVHDRDDIISYCEAKNKFKQYKRYGSYGDVIIYRPMGSKKLVPIIHRAICWVDYDEKNGTYTIEEYGIYNATSVDIPELGLHGVKFSHSGFITKGDHNPCCDQSPLAGICREPVKMEWIVGKAEGELPWFGSLKLLFENSHREVPSDSWLCLSISIIIMITIPMVLDVKDYIRERRGFTPREGWLGQLGKNPAMRKKVLKKVTTLYWILFISLIPILYLYPFLLIIPSLLILANLYAALLLIEDKKRWNKNSSPAWPVLSCFASPLILTLYYMRIRKEI